MHELSEKYQQKIMIKNTSMTKKCEKKSLVTKQNFEKLLKKIHTKFFILKICYTMFLENKKKIAYLIKSRCTYILLCNSRLL
jgi:hypothetical protein